MCQSIEDVDRISWEAEMMRAEEHFYAMDDDEDGDCAGERTELVLCARKDKE